MSRVALRFATLIVLARLLPSATGQTSAGLDAHEDFALKQLPLRILADQKHFLTSPARLKKRDLEWLAPVGILSGILIANDQHFMNVHVKSNPDAIHNSTIVSNATLGALVAIPAGLYVLGKVHYDAHLQEGASLAAESLADGLIAAPR